MRTATSLLTSLVVLIGLAIGAWLLGLGEPIRAGLTSGRLWEWAAAFGALLWLWAVLKWPWDLYFRTRQVAFELTRSVEKGLQVKPERKGELERLQKKLLAVAIGAHLGSAAVLAGITYLSGGKLGYLFALGYLASTAIRPLVAAYGHLMHRLSELDEELRYPRQDVLELRSRMDSVELQVRQHQDELRSLQKALSEETALRDQQTRALRLTLEQLGREFEKAMSRLGDNQEVVRGIQALARLVAQSAKG